MENNYLLNKDYIRIKNMNTISYGGNQSWCKSKKMQKVGCGSHWRIYPSILQNRIPDL
jgi:hypothetical protein